MPSRPLAATLAATLVGWLVPPVAPQGDPSLDPPAPPAPPAAVAPLPSVTPAPAPQPDAARMRELQEVLYAREALTLSRGGSVKSGETTIRTGNLYLLAGRPDLVSEIRQRRAAKGVLMGAGIGVAAFGAAWGLMDAAAAGAHNAVGAVTWCSLRDPNMTEPSCMEREASPLPWMLALTGGAAAVAGAVIPSDPLNREAKRALVDDYNRRLRARMGLSSMLDTAARTASVRAAVRPDGKSGVVTAGWSF
jgi:hypothetical protein